MTILPRSCKQHQKKETINITQMEKPTAENQTVSIYLIWSDPASIN